MMIALIKYVYEWLTDTARFTAAVWHDARALQAEAEQKYGPMGF